MRYTENYTVSYAAGDGNQTFAEVFVHKGTGDVVIEITADSLSSTDGQITVIDSINNIDYTDLKDSGGNLVALPLENGVNKLVLTNYITGYFKLKYSTTGAPLTGNITNISILFA